MNDKLNLILSMIKNGTGVIDVGTDHGFLPIALAKSGYSGNIIASDINQGPISRAEANAKQAGVESRIKFCLSDGLESCVPDEVDTIVIAGMGGDAICSILDRAPWCMSERYNFILQPMKKADILRYWLCNNGFYITGEKLVKDSRQINQVIAARFGHNMKLSDSELFSGKYELAKNNELFSEQLDVLTERFIKASEGMKNAQDKSACYKIYLSIANEFKLMREKYDKDKRYF